MVLDIAEFMEKSSDKVENVQENGANVQENVQENRVDVQENVQEKTREEMILNLLQNNRESFFELLEKVVVHCNDIQFLNLLQLFVIGNK